jgi:hypothetical protein
MAGMNGRFDATCPVVCRKALLLGFLSLFESQSSMKQTPLFWVPHKGGVFEWDKDLTMW